MSEQLHLEELLLALPESLDNAILLLRHAERDSVAGMDRKDRDSEPLNAKGRTRTLEVAKQLPKVRAVAAWGALRTHETARVLVDGIIASTGRRPILSYVPGMDMRGSVIEWRGGRPGVEYEFYKQRHGWKKLIEEWLNHKLPPEILSPPGEVVAFLFREWLSVANICSHGGEDQESIAIIVASDFHIIAVLAELRGLTRHIRVPYLGGIILDQKVMRKYCLEHSVPPPAPHMRVTAQEETEALKKPMVIGLGTGRCGTQSLAKLFMAQPGLPPKEVHEKSASPYLTTTTEMPLIRALVATLKVAAPSIAASVHCAWLLHVDKIIAAWPNTKVVVIERNREAVIDSFMRITGNTCYWLEHDGEVFKKDEYYDDVHPKFPLSEIVPDPDITWEDIARSKDLRNEVKRRAAGRYWDWYAKKARSFEANHRQSVRIISVERLNDLRSQETLLRWLGIGEPVLMDGVFEDGALPFIMKRTSALK